MISLLNNQKQIKMKNESNLTEKMVAVTNIVEERNINEIISELKSHSDFIHSEIFCWSDVIESINESLYENMYYDVIDELTFEDLTNEMKIDIKEKIESVITIGLEYRDPFPENVHLNKKGELIFN